MKLRLSFCHLQVTWN